jgi:conjugal transfer pilus assembly protein TraV
MKSSRFVLFSVISSAVLSLAGCASAVNPCKDEYGGLCTSPREMYGVTRNRDQVNPPKDVLANQQKAGAMINANPAPSEKLPSISPAKPQQGAAVTPAGAASGATTSLLPSRVVSEDQGAVGGEVMRPGPFATDAFGGQNTPMPLLRQPKVVRVWVAPYVGADNTLHFPGYIYTVIQPGTWSFGEASQAAQPPMPSPAQVRSGN